MIFLLVLGVVLLAVAIRMSLPAVRRRRLAWELRRDWWSRFERDFQAYVRSRERNAQDRAR
jgi:hypothetical protein